MSYYLFYFLIAMNILGFFAMLIDKQKSKRGVRRISEKSLLIIAGLGGSVGTYLAMKIFRHKTKHLKFVLGVPMLFIAQSIILVLIFR